MSRIGKLPIQIPDNLQVEIKGGQITIKSANAQLSQEIETDLIAVKFDAEAKQVIVERKDDTKQAKSFHGLYRSLINNMVIGLSKGYKKVLEVHGVGYKVKISGNKLELALGFSHPVFFEVPEQIKVSSEKSKIPNIILESYDKQLVGEVAAKIRAFKKPEPYKGKGIRYNDEVVRRKAGKTAAKA